MGELLRHRPRVYPVQILRLLSAMRVDTCSINRWSRRRRITVNIFAEYITWNARGCWKPEVSDASNVCLKRLPVTYLRKVSRTEIVRSRKTIFYLEKKKISVDCIIFHERISRILFILSLCSFKRLGIVFEARRIDFTILCINSGIVQRYFVSSLRGLCVDDWIIYLINSKYYSKTRGGTCCK